MVQGNSGSKSEIALISTTSPETCPTSPVHYVQSPQAHPLVASVTHGGFP